MKLCSHKTLIISFFMNQYNGRANATALSWNELSTGHCGAAALLAADEAAPAMPWPGIGQGEGNALEIEAKEREKRDGCVSRGLTGVRAHSNELSWPGWCLSRRLNACTGWGRLRRSSREVHGQASEDSDSELRHRAAMVPQRRGHCGAAAAVDGEREWKEGKWGRRPRQAWASISRPQPGDGVAAVAAASPPCGAASLTAVGHQCCSCRGGGEWSKAGPACGVGLDLGRLAHSSTVPPLFLNLFF